MLELMLIRLVAPRAFQLINVLGLAFICVGLLAVTSGIVAHDGTQEVPQHERVQGMR